MLLIPNALLPGIQIIFESEMYCLAYVVYKMDGDIHSIPATDILSRT